MQRKHQSGVSLVEMAVVGAIGAVLVSVAAPNLGAAIERRAVEGASAQFETDVQLARSGAVARNEALRLRFENNCYVMHTGPADGCKCEASGTPVCTAGAVPLRSVSYGATAGVSLASNVRYMVFDQNLGTVTPAGTVRVVGTSGAEVRSVVNVMGRVRQCSPAGAGAMAGYAVC